VPMNAVVRNIRELEQVPIRAGTYPAVFLRDVGSVEDGSDVVTCYALVNGRPTVYIPVTKRADASTLAVVDLVKQNLPRLQSVLPDDVRVSYEFDQSPYVTRAIQDLLKEGVLGALLAGLMVLLFLRDWRSAGIVVLNIPLSLMGALVALWITGQNINLMTLGGLALAVGILVDQATVTIENTHTHLLQGQGLARAALDATAETSLPQFLAMVCIVAVFLPTFFMAGAGRALFVPLALAVGFAMIASFILSATLVPILSVWLLRGHGSLDDSPGFARARASYARRLGGCMRWRGAVVAAYLVLCALLILGFGRRLGVEIFPRVEAGQLQLRLRAPTGTRLERTQALTLAVLDEIKREVGPGNVTVSLAFIGVHSSSYPVNLIYLWNSGPEEAVLQVQLRRGATLPTARLQERLRTRLAAKLPDLRLSFEPSDIVSRVMSLGSPTPIEIAVSGPNLAANRRHLEKIRARLAALRPLRDLQFGEALDYPTVDVALDRERAGLLGIKVQDATRAFVAATASSRFTTPVFWADPESGVSYRVQVQIPKTRMTSLEEIRNIPIANIGGNAVLLRSVAHVATGTAVGHYGRYNMQRTLTLTANIAGTDLGRATRQVAQVLHEMGAPPRGVTVALRGQVVPLEEMLGGLRTGLLLAVVVVFLMLAANFQSLRLSLAVVSTVPATIAGVVLALALTGTTLNVESFMGAIMAIGVAVANAILLVTFAERSRSFGAPADTAAVEGARSRLRPILMTSLAMIAGMLPMALGVGEGGEQTAPLGRAVVGGLMAATVATLVVLPSVFAMVQARQTTRSASLDPDDPDGACYELPST
jgi:multidrug efflux pump subunit AcrB